MKFTLIDEEKSHHPISRMCRWNAPTLRTTRNESPLVMMVPAALEGGA